METFRKYGSHPYHVVAIHGGSGAVGSLQKFYQILEQELFGEPE
jgi:hypothetical protein